MAADRQREGADCRFVIRPNCSLSWRSLKRVFAGLATVTLAIACYFAWHGAWLILPFAGLELVFLGAVLYIVARRSRQCEVITIEGEHIHIERGINQPEEHHALERAWSRVRLLRGDHATQASRLLLGTPGCEVEVGACLTENERRQLAQELRRELPIHRLLAS